MKFKMEPRDASSDPSNDPGSNTMSPVGYKRPPTATRFKKGRSGIPKGRPRGSKTLAKTLKKVLAQTISVTIAGKAKRMSKGGAIPALMANRAIKGDAKAIEAVLSLAERVGRLDRPSEDGLVKHGFLVVPGTANSWEEWNRRNGAAARGERPTLNVPLTHENGDSFLARGRLRDTFTCFKAHLSNCKKRAAEHASDADAEEDVWAAVRRITVVSFRSLLRRDYAQALEAADLAISESPEVIWFHALRALALMFIGRVEEARALFHKYQGQKDHRKNSWNDYVLWLFDRLRQEDLTHPLMAEIEERFAAGGGALNPMLGHPASTTGGGSASIIPPADDIASGDKLAEQGASDEALAVYRRRLDICQTKLANGRVNIQAIEDRGTAVDRISDLSLRFILEGHVEKAMNALDFAVSVLPNSLWGNLRRAHALMLADRVDEARTLYLGFRGTKVSPQRSAESVILGEFGAIREVPSRGW